MRWHGPLILALTMITGGAGAQAPVVKGDEPSAWSPGSFAERTPEEQRLQAKAVVDQLLPLDVKPGDAVNSTSLSSEAPAPGAADEK